MSDVSQPILSQPAATSIDEGQADLLTQIEEGQYSDVKAIAITPSKLSHSISAFANTDGGDLYIGIGEEMLGGNVKRRDWSGFPDVEAANGHIQAFERVFPLGKDFQYEFLRCPARKGVVLHVQVSRTREVIRATDGKPYIRRAAQNLPQDTADQPQRSKTMEHKPFPANMSEEFQNAQHGWDHSTGKPNPAPIDAEKRAARIAALIEHTQAAEDGQLEDFQDGPAQYLVVEYGSGDPLFAMAALTMDEAARYIDESDTQRDSVTVYDLDGTDEWTPVFETTRFIRTRGENPGVHNVHPQR